MTGSPRFSGGLFGAAHHAEYAPEGSLESEIDLGPRAALVLATEAER